MTERFRTRLVIIGPGETRAFEEDEWRDSIVFLEQGDLELECERGGRRCFERGAVLWLTGLALLAIHNRGPDPTVLMAVSRVGRRRD